MRMSKEKFNKRERFVLINRSSGGLIIPVHRKRIDMMEAERITNEVMDRNQMPTRRQVELDRQWSETGYEELGIGFDHTGQYDYPHANALGEGPNVSTLPPDEGLAFVRYIGGVLAFEALVGIAIWGMWELHRPVMLMVHWLVSHAY
jgi:hypothetical protein